MRLLGASRGGGTERFGQPTAKIDGCSRQNPAYRRSRISGSAQILSRLLFLFSVIFCL